MLILLVGPKGSGKSHIGRVLETKLGIHFFHVEARWMAYHASCRFAKKEPEIAEGIRLIHPWVTVALERHTHVCVETTGASTEILEDLRLRGQPFGLIVARVHAPLDVCLRRIGVRDPTAQLPLNAVGIAEVHRVSVARELAADIRIENNGLDDKAIVEAFAVIPALQNFQRTPTGQVKRP